MGSGRSCGKAPGAHIWNHIGIGGENRMVDVTFGDMGGNTPPNHYFLNFGEDRKDTHTWSKDVYPYPFARTTDDSYSFYCNQSDNTGYVARDLNDAAEYFVWKAQQGHKSAEVIIKGKTWANDNTIHNAIQQVLKKNRYSANSKKWTLWNMKKGKNTILVIRWDRF